MEIATQNRSKYERWLAEIKPKKILAPFGVKKDFLSRLDNRVKVITRPRNRQRISNKRTNSSLHAKAIIGERYALTGSCNFTENSLNKMHEILTRIDSESCEKERKAYNKLENYFDKLWERSEPFEGINDTI